MKNDFSDLFSVSGKVAVVTGGTGIQGKRITQGLAAYGADIAVVDLNVEMVKAQAAIISKKFGVNAIGIACDVSDKNAVSMMVEDVVKQFI